jgi:F-type H+-transporting ATPase subunit b
MVERAKGEALAIVAKAEEEIRASRKEALANIETIAAELTQDIAGKVAGLKVSRDDAAKAVKAELTHG